jgi:hypothetical protein
METDINLFIEILKKYLYYFINGNEAVSILRKRKRIPTHRAGIDHSKVSEWLDHFDQHKYA